MAENNNILFLFFQKLIQPFRWFVELSAYRKFKVVVIMLFSGVLLGCSIIALVYFSVVNGVFGKVPSVEELKHLSNAKASEVYSSDGVLLGRYYTENRTDVKYEEVNPVLIKALVATEDSRFYEHEGVDHVSMMRVLVKSIILGQNKGGGSTLSQQLAKNIFGRKSFGALSMPVNKMREAIIANRMEQVYSKKEILMLYLNTVSFGEDTYGVETASERFFSVSVANIRTEEAAVLIGMLKSPTLYNPRTKHENALKRRNIVVHQLYANEFITLSERDSLQNLPLELNYKRLSHKEGVATHFREYLRKYLTDWLVNNPKPDGSFYDLYTDGLVINTTIHSQLQQYAQASVVERMMELQPLLNKDLIRNKVFTKNKNNLIAAVKKSTRYKKNIASGLSETEVLEIMKKPIQINLLTLTGKLDTLLSPIDSVKNYLSQLQAGFLSINPKNGKVMAWVGGASFQQNQYDHVLSKRQVGSIFKPIVYAQALLSGKQPCDYIPNQEVVYTQYENWSPKNAGGKDGGKYSIAGALANSVNTISAKLCMDVGIKNVIDLANKMHIDEEFPEVPSIALGVVETSLMKMVGAYTVFVNDGVYAAPQFIETIKNSNGELIFKSEVESEQILSEDIAHQMINMMQGVVDRGTANRLRTRYGIRGAVVGKTGTTQNQKDGWFMGCTPNWIAGSWVGANYPYIHFSTTRDGQGANTALPIWAKYYQKIKNDTALSYLVSPQFYFDNNIDCEDFKEDGFFGKIFKKKNKKDKREGLDKKKKRGLFKKKEK
ncbi:MAG: transglycosylase domain-containing protein [Vicingaceae bacterium]